jgi:hypothetical protein
MRDEGWSMQTSRHPGMSCHLCIYAWLQRTYIWCANFQGCTLNLISMYTYMSVGTINIVKNRLFQLGMRWRWEFVRISRIKNRVRICLVGFNLRVNCDQLESAVLCAPKKFKVIGLEFEFADVCHVIYLLVMFCFNQYYYSSRAKWGQH